MSGNIWAWMWGFWNATMAFVALRALLGSKETLLEPIRGDEWQARLAALLLVVTYGLNAYLVIR